MRSFSCRFQAIFDGFFVDFDILKPRFSSSIRSDFAPTGCFTEYLPLSKSYGSDITSVPRICLAAILRKPAAYEPIPPRAVGNRRRIVFGELAGKTGAAYLMSLLGLEKDDNGAKAVASGLKNLRMGDLIEIPLEDRLEKKIIKDE